MSRMLCSISDDPYNDYSDYIEGTGVYKGTKEVDGADIFKWTQDQTKASLFLTKTMLNKSIIDANKSVIILAGMMDLSYDNMVAGHKHSYPAIFENGVESQVNFYKTKRGDKRLSVKNLKSQAEAGMVLRLVVDWSWDIADSTGKPLITLLLEVI